MLTEHQKNELHRRAMKLAEEINLYDISRFASLGDEKIEKTEHVCHELAHAVMLGLDPMTAAKLTGDVLDDRIDRKLRLLDGEAADRNEVRCFPVVRRVLKHFGYHYSREAMMDAVNTKEHWAKSKISKEWSSFDKSPECVQTAARIVKLIERIP